MPRPSDPGASLPKDPHPRLRFRVGENLDRDLQLQKLLFSIAAMTWDFVLTEDHDYVVHDGKLVVDRPKLIRELGRYLQAGRWVRGGEVDPQDRFIPTEDEIERLLASAKDYGVDFPSEPVRWLRRQDRTFTTSAAPVYPRPGSKTQVYGGSHIRRPVVTIDLDTANHRLLSEGGFRPKVITDRAITPWNSDDQVRDWIYAECFVSRALTALSHKNPMIPRLRRGLDYVYGEDDRYNDIRVSRHLVFNLDTCIDLMAETTEERDRLGFREAHITELRRSLTACDTVKGWRQVFHATYGFVPVEFIPGAGFPQASAFLRIDCLGYSYRKEAKRLMTEQNEVLLGTRKPADVVPMRPAVIGNARDITGNARVCKNARRLSERHLWPAVRLPGYPLPSELRRS